MIFWACIYFFGFITALIFIKEVNIEFQPQNFSSLGVLKTFCLNYWIIFLIIITNEIPVSYIIKPLIVYFRGFTYGVLFLSLFKINLFYLISITIIDAIFFLTILFLVCYRKRYSNINNQNIKIIMMSIIIILVYSTLLELVGGSFG